MHVEAGLHTVLSEDPELSAAAASAGVELRDLRAAPPGLSVPPAARPDVRVVHTVGSDCAIGKMSVTLELDAAARARGLSSAFVATGQTGIAITGWGIAVDHVISDFIAGAAARLVAEGASRAPLLFVEGQGALGHPAYSGVTLGLLHGCLPDALVLCHKAGTTFIDDYPETPILPLARADRGLRGRDRLGPPGAGRRDRAEHARVERRRGPRGLRGRRGRDRPPGHRPRALRRRADPGGGRVPARRARVPAESTRVSAPVAADVHIALRDGSTARVRPVSPADEPALRTFLGGLSDNSRWLRFFSLGVNLDKAAVMAAKGDRPEGYGLIVTTGAEERVVAHAVFELERPDRAEVAFAVADEMQGRGLATVLIAHLAQVASARGVTTFTATVLPENRRMISVFRESGFPVHVRASPDGIELEFPTELGEDARRKFEDRDRVAAVAAVERVLKPRSVAVIGASRRPGSFGGAAFRHALDNGFRGELYPVNPNADFIGSRRAAASVKETPGPVDLAIVAVPAETVPGGRARVRRGGRGRARGHHRGVRRDGRRGRGAAGGAARGLPVDRDAARRAELDGRRQHRSRRSPSPARSGARTSPPGRSASSRRAGRSGRRRSTACRAAGSA